MRQFELSNEYLEWIREMIEGREVTALRESLEGVNPADISTLLHELNTEESKYIIDLLDKEVGAEILRDLDEDTQTEFLKVFTPEEIAIYIDIVNSDDAADILNNLPVKEREEVIANLENPEKAANILDLLRYEEDCAGGLMAKELIKCNINWDVVECIAEIRRQAEDVEKVYSVYVVDDQDRLMGRVSLKRIILSGGNTKIRDIYTDDLISVETYMHEETVAEIMKKYDLEAVPVVNVQGKLVGRITIDDVIDVITELIEQERQLMSGISEDVDEDDSIWMLTRARLPWLMIGVVGGLVGAQIMGVFEESISSIPAMAFFVPLITATGGNVGIQSSSIVLQSLANRSAFEAETWSRYFKVLMVATLNGLALAFFVWLMNVILGEEAHISFVVSASLFSVVLLASFTGTITPIILDKFGVNPALASGPFITTANDILGLGVYFSVAHLLL